MKIIGEPEIPQPVHKQTVDKQIVIDTNPYRTRVALLEDGKTVELHIEQRSNDMLVGNIYKGRVSNVLPGMEAAFVDISEDKMHFIRRRQAERAASRGSRAAETKKSACLSGC